MRDFRKMKATGFRLEIQALKSFFGGKATGFREKGCLNKVKMLRIFLFAAKKESKTAAVPMRRAPAKGPEGPFGNPKGQ